MLSSPATWMVVNPAIWLGFSAMNCAVVSALSLLLVKEPIWATVSAAICPLVKAVN